MINYDLPWNPNRIDQRIGRLHRYGQKRDVNVYNLQVANSREGAIFIRLQEKVKIIKVFINMRGEYDADASKVLLNALFDGYEEPTESFDDFILQIGKLVELADEKANELGEKKRQEVKAEREKQYRVLKADLERYFNRRTTETKWRLNEYEQRQLKGEDMGISIERALYYNLIFRFGSIYRF